MIGEQGIAKTEVHKGGTVFVHGEYWNAKADGEIPVGEKVKVVGYDGMCLKVSRLTQSEQGS